tara:strand:- start:605 stop:850 length:246 start_codon:yes stop_codon:yes gene_type:complete
MNTSINSAQENANVLLSLTNSYDKVDISAVNTIIGTSESITAVIEIDKFIGVSSQNIIITNPDVNDNVKSYFISKGLTILS